MPARTARHAEDRLDRLAEDVVDIRERMARHEERAVAIADGVERIEAAVGKLADAVSAQSARTAALEAERDTRRRRWTAAGKVALPVVVAFILAFLGLK